MQSTLSKEKIKSLLLDESLKETIKEILKSQGVPYHTPCLKIELSDSKRSSFQIDQSDFLKIFTYFGQVRDIKVFGNIALILFKDLVSAYFAQKVFNNKEVPELNLVLSVSWYYNQDETNRVPLAEIQSSSKYTARFDIQIENDDDFQVARKLIGPKGVNMKNIVEKCCQGLNGPVHDIIKLRLRGRGSGFKEGPEQVESNENLHICISSKYSDLLQIATDEIEKLVLSVYKEYYSHRSKKGLPEVKLNLKKVV